MSLLLIGAFACSSSDPVGTAEKGILKGIVDIGPLCPVEIRDDDCPPDPSLFSSHYLLIQPLTGNKVIEVVPIHPDGTYEIELDPGQYRVDFTPHNIGTGNFVPPRTSVHAGETTILDIHIDTGIR